MGVVSLLFYVTSLSGLNMWGGIFKGDEIVLTL